MRRERNATADALICVLTRGSRHCCPRRRLTLPNTTSSPPPEEVDRQWAARASVGWQRRTIAMRIRYSILIIPLVVAACASSAGSPSAAAPSVAAPSEAPSMAPSEAPSEAPSVAPSESVAPADPFATYRDGYAQASARPDHCGAPAVRRGLHHRYGGRRRRYRQDRVRDGRLQAPRGARIGDCDFWPSPSRVFRNAESRRRRKRRASSPRSPRIHRICSGRRRTRIRPMP